MNKLFMLLIVLICLILMPVIGRSQATLSGDTKLSKKDEASRHEVLRLEEAGRQRVLKGENNWDDIMADGAYMIDPFGNVSVYEKGKGFPPFPVTTFTLTEMIARPYGEVVVVSGLGEITTETADKKPLIFRLRFINVWRKLPEGWKIVVNEHTPVKGSIAEAK